MRSPVGALVSGMRGAAARLAGSALSARDQLPTPYVARADLRGQMGDSGTYNREGQIAATASSGTLFSIINTLSTGVASIPWHMHATTRVRSGASCTQCDQEGVRFVDAHPALSVLNTPNDFFTRQELIESIQQHIDLVGEGWMTVEYLAGRPIGLWPVRPDRMAPVRDPKTFLTGYVYRAPDGQLVPLRRDEVIYIRVPAPWDVYRGAGAVQTLMNQLYGARYAAEWNRRFFENSALPGGLVEIPSHLDDVQFDEFQERWAETHRGVNNAHTVAMLEYGAKWIDLKYSQKDMEFAELSRVTREEMREAFGIHGHILGLSENVNRANAEAADATHARRKLVPRADRWQGAFNNDFLKLFTGMSKGYEFVYESPVPEDDEAANAERASKTTAFKTLIDAGADPEYAAMVVGLPPPTMASAPRPAVATSTGEPNLPGGNAPGEAGPQSANEPNSPGGNGSTQGDGGSGNGDGASMDTLRTWAPVRLAARNLPAMLNSIRETAKSER